MHAIDLANDETESSRKRPQDVPFKRMSSPISRGVFAEIREIRRTIRCAIHTIRVHEVIFYLSSFVVIRIAARNRIIFTQRYVQSRQIHTITASRWSNRRTTSPLSASGTSSTPWTATSSACCRLRCSRRWSDCCRYPCCSYPCPCAARCPPAAASRPRGRSVATAASAVLAPIPRVVPRSRNLLWSRLRHRLTYRRPNRCRNRTKFRL